eukprot:3037906-Pyramimonas_sp.AAC.1
MPEEMRQAKVGSPCFITVASKHLKHRHEGEGSQPLPKDHHHERLSQNKEGRAEVQGNQRGEV